MLCCQTGYKDEAQKVLLICVSLITMQSRFILSGASQFNEIPVPTALKGCHGPRTVFCNT